MGWKEQELVFQMCWSISLTRAPGWESCTQEEDVMSIIKNAEDETERSLKNIKAVGFLVSFGCLRLKLLLHALTAHEKLLNYSLFQLYALPFSCHWQVRQIITVSQHQMTSRHKINVLPLRCSRFRPIGVHQWESTNESNEGIWSDMRLSHWMVCREYDFNFILADAALGFQKEGLPWDENGSLKVFKMLRMLWMLRWMLATLSITWLNHSHPGLLCFDGWRPKHVRPMSKPLRWSFRWRLWWRWEG